MTKKLTLLFALMLSTLMASAQNAYKKAYEKAKKAEMTQSSTTAATAKAMNPPTPNSLTKKIVMERRYLVNKANNYCYPATCFRMDNNLQLEIRYFNTDHYQGSYSVTRHGIYIAVGRCEDVNFDWNVKDCDYFDAWCVCAVTTDQWVNEKIEFDESGNVSYYMNGKYMGTHMFEMLKKLAGSKTVTFDINPYGWYTGQHHYMDDLKLTLPGKTISDNFNDGVIDSKIWQTPTNPSGVREEGGILKTEQVRTDWPYHLRTIALSLTGGSQNNSSNSTLAQKTTMTAEEMYKLGLNYYEGKNGKTQNYTEAVKWFRQAAEQGNAKAQTFMGVCCYNGSGVTQDYNEALKWYRKAAEQGYAIAQSNLGACYYNGKIVTRDYTEALKWYRKAAEQGHATAQYNVGNCYEKGYGVTKDNFQAAKWYRKAADQNNENAKNKLAGLNLSSITAGATAQSKSPETTSQDTFRNLLIAGALEMVAFYEAVEKTDYAKYTASSQAAFNYFKRVYAAANNKWPDIMKDAQDGALEIYERTQGLSGIAAVYYVQKEYRKAFDAFYVARKAFKEPVLTSNPQAQNAIKECSRDSVINGLALKCAGIALYDLKDTAAAIKELVLLKNRVKEKNLMNEVYQNLAMIYYKKDDSASYESILKEGAEKMPNEPWYINNLISHYCSYGNYVSAHQYLDKSITKYPNNADFYFAKGFLLEVQDKADEALTFYQKELKLNPNSIRANFAVGRYYSNRGMDIYKYDEESFKKAQPLFDQAISYLEKAYSLDTNQTEKQMGRDLLMLYRMKGGWAGRNTPEEKQWIEKIKKVEADYGLE